MATAAIPHNTSYHAPQLSPPSAKHHGSTGVPAAELAGNTGLLSATSWDPTAFDSCTYTSNAVLAPVIFWFRS